MIYSLDNTDLIEPFLRAAAARLGRLLAFLALWCTAIIILHEIISFISVALVATPFARLCHLDRCVKARFSASIENQKVTSL